MHIVYIISVYKLPGSLIRLVNRLQSRNVTFFIHVDKKSPAVVFRQIQEGLKAFSNVQFLVRHNCFWGDFGHVQATLTGIKELLKRDILFDYVVLLTGQDYPIKKNSDIEAFFLHNYGKSFISYSELPCPNWDIMDRIERWFFRVGNTSIGFPLDANGDRYRRLLFIKKLVNLFLPKKRKFLKDIKPYGGLSYWNLSKEAINYIIDYLDSHPEYVRFFRSTFISDEMFFQTLLLNSHLKGKVVNDSLRYVKWGHKERNPAILTRDDFDTLCSSPKLFARKFDQTVDSDILDSIDKYLLNS